MFGGLAALRRLARVTSPLLYFRSAEDHVVDPRRRASSPRASPRATYVERMLQDSFHVATLDNDAEHLRGVGGVRRPGHRLTWGFPWFVSARTTPALAVDVDNYGDRPELVEAPVGARASRRRCRGWLPTPVPDVEDRFIPPPPPAAPDAEQRAAVRLAGVFGSRWCFSSAWWSGSRCPRSSATCSCRVRRRLHLPGAPDAPQSRDPDDDGARLLGAAPPPPPAP